MRALLPLCVLLAGCAYIGEPLPPTLRIPQAVSDLQAVQRGGKIYVTFTPATLTTDGLPLETPGAALLVIGEAGAQPDQPVEAPVRVEPWIGKEVVIGLRTEGPTGRLSAWSNLATLRVLAALAAPAGLRATATQDGVQLNWRGDGASYRIYRNGELAATVEKAEFLDAAAEFSTQYEYAVEAILDGAESERSAQVKITPEDVFPPNTPAGLEVVAGVAAAELSWERNLAPDLSHYRVYRDGVMAADKVTGNVFSDPGVRPGGRYRYAVSSVDQKANESEKSPETEVVFP